MSDNSPILSKRNSPRKNLSLERMLNTCTHIVIFCKTGVEPEVLMALRRTEGETIVFKVDSWTS